MALAFIGSVLGLCLETTVPLLGHGQLDALASGQRDVRLGALADHKDVVQPGHKDPSNW